MELLRNIMDEIDLTFALFGGLLVVCLIRIFISRYIKQKLSL